MGSLSIDRNALLAMDTLRINARDGQKIITSLSTGRRIQSAVDNAASLSIGQELATQYGSMQVANRNLHDGLSLVETAEGALAQAVEDLQRMRELAVQAATGTLVADQRAMLDREYQELRQHIASIVESTTWNGHRLFRKLSANQFVLQAGPNAGDEIRIDIPKVYASGTSIGFQNGDFEQDAIGSTAVSGWTVGNSRVTLDGASTIGGWPTPVDTTKPSVSGGDAVGSSRATFATSVVASDNPLGGAKSLKLASTGVSVAGYGIVHGPYIISNNSTTIEAGGTVSFDWKASGGADAYDVYAYLLNVDTGSTLELLNQSGTSGSMTSNWATVSATVPASGNYKFVFVSGTFDATGGTAAGAQLFIDNINAPPIETPTLDATSITTVSNANQSMNQIDDEIESISHARSALGTSIKRIFHAVDNLAQRMTDTAQSSSRVSDVDYASASADWSRIQVRETAAQFALGKARENQMNSLEMIRSNARLFEL